MCALAAATAHVSGQTPLVPSANVNMVRGTAFVDGDPYLQRQNEPSIAISTRNPCHLLAGANDYRTVDYPDPTPLPNEGTAPIAPDILNPRDAWLGVFTSTDCGATWRSRLLPGHPFDTSPEGQAPGNVNRGFSAGADPVVRAGTNGLFFYAGLVFDRADQSRSQIFLARFIDNNNKERGETIAYVDASAVDTGDPEVFVDKPWLAVDHARAGAATCSINGQQFPAGRVYVAWTRFEGGGARVMVARSIDCGQTWQAQALTDTAQVNQGASLAIAQDGTVYAVWRQFGRDGVPSSIQIATSRDGGVTFTRAAVAASINPFDQTKLENRRFRTNTLPTVAADHLGRVYVAWAERGFALASGRTHPTTGDARIVLAVSADGGRTFAPRYPIDDTLLDADGAPRFGHQVMPALTFTAGKLQAIYYDFSDDFAGTFNPFIDEAETPPVDPTNPTVRRRHTVDVRAAHADPGAQPRFVPVVITPAGTTPRLSQYRTIVDPDGTIRQVQFNPPNLPLFVGGTTPFIGDYIDVAGLNFVPYQGGWRHNNGTTVGPRVDGVFPATPFFHAAWTDHRDVKAPADGDWTLYRAPGDPFWKLPGSECIPDRAGMRNANIYTARIGNGLYAGSPANTKPLGFRRDPATNQPLVDPTTGRSIHMQRSFVVFVQNSLRVPKTYVLRIVNQPGSLPGDRASFLRAPQPPFSDADLATRAHVWLVAKVAPLSTISRTVFVTAANERAMVRVDVLEVPAATPQGIGTDPRLSPLPVANGLRATVLLNPDPTNPPILDPDFVDTTVPVLAEETHDPEIFDPVVTTIPNVTRTVIELRNPDEANPDEANPDEANVDEEMPDEANPDEANPDEANPDEANPDEANPDEANAALANTALSDAQLQTAHIVDVQWKVQNRGNTTTAFRFSPTFSGEREARHFQLLVTKRYYVPAVDGRTCDLGVRRTNQVLVNVSGFQPRNPDEANPDEANPDEANPDEANPDEANPDEANPDEANATFFLAPGETATATLRIYDLSSAAPPPPPVLAAFEDSAAAVVESFAANTGEAAPPRDAAGADLTATDAVASPANVAPGGTTQVTWTLTNQGTEPTEAGAFQTRVLFSTDRDISDDDTELAVVPFTGSVPPDDPATPGVNEGAVTQVAAVTIPAGVTSPTRFILVLADAVNDVPEADEANNAAAAQLGGTYALAFTAPPTNTTAGFTFTSAVTVAVLESTGLPAPPNAVPFVRLSLASGPAGVTLGGTVTAPTVNGVATFTDITVPAPGTYTLAATAVGLEGPAPAAPAVSAPFSVGADDPPVAVPDAYTVAVNGELDIPAATGVIANDTDELRAGPGVPPAGRTLAATLVRGTDFGTLTFGPQGGFAYVPNAGFDGVDFFTYRLNDGVADGNVVTVRISVGTGQGNARPVTRPLNATVAEDSVSTPIDVLAASLDADGDSLSIAGASATNGTVVVSGGLVRYTPAADYSGPDTIDYTVSDGRGGSAPGAVSVTVTPVNDNPVAQDDGPFVIPVNSVTTDFAVVDNDHDGPDSGETLTVVRVGGARNGAAAFTASEVRYTPFRDRTGTDTVTYEISDGNGGTASAVVRILIGGDNQTPTAVDDEVTTSEDSGSTFNLVANDTDADRADILRITSVGDAQRGTVDFDPAVNPSAVRYTPPPDFTGTDTFTYTVTDGNGGTDTGSVTVTVTPVNDTPTAIDDETATPRGRAIDIDVRVNDVDPDDCVGCTPIQRGGEFIFFASDRDGGLYHIWAARPDGSDLVQLTTGDADESGPRLRGDGRTLVFERLVGSESELWTLDLVTGVESRFAGPADVPGSPYQASWSPDGTQLAFTVAINGRADIWVSPYPAVSGGFRRVTPDDGLTRIAPSWASDDTLLVQKWADGLTPSIWAVDVATGAETLVVASRGGEWYPRLSPDGLTLLWSSEAHSPNGDVYVAPYRGPALIPEADQRRLTPTSGINWLAWSPEGHRIVAETYPSIRDIIVLNLDGTGRHTAVVDPNNETDPWWGVVARAPLTPGSQPSTLQVIAIPTVDHGGAVVLPSGLVRFTPEPGYTGPASFTYTLSDGEATDTAVVSVAVLDVNAPPVATDDGFEVAEDNTGISYGVLANDTDPNTGDVLRVTAVTQPSVPGAGVVDFDPDEPATVRFIPAPNFNGIVTFTYTVSDGHGGFDVGTVTATVTAVNDPPFVAVAIPDQSVSDSAPDGSVALADHFADVDIATNGDALNFSVLSNSNPAVVAAGIAGGTLTLDYLAAGTATITIRAEDAFDAAAEDTFVVTVSSSNSPPVANDDELQVDEDGDATFDVIANDTDGDEDTLVIDAIGGAQHGTVEQNSATPRQVRYIPHANFNGNDSFSYTIRDGRGGFDTATVHVTVAAVNDPPTFLAALPDRNVDAGAPNDVVDLTQFFTDVDIATNGDALTFSVVENSVPAVVSATVNGSQLTLDYDAPGTSTVAVRATDAQNEFYTDAFFVTVGSTNQAPVANPDSASTTTGVPVTINVLANDTDSDRGTAGARLVAAMPLNPPGITGNNPFIGGTIAGPGTPYVYAGGISGISVIDTRTNAVVEFFDTSVISGSPTRGVLDPVNGIVYIATSTNGILAIDARETSPTLNEPIMYSTVGGSRINALVVDGVRQRLYVFSETLAQMGSTAALTTSRIVVIDADPDAPSFGDTIRLVPAPTSFVTGEVNPATGDLIVGSSGTNSGVRVLDWETFELRSVTGVLPVIEIVLDAAADRAYGLSSGGQVLAIALSTESLVPNSVFAVPGLATPNTPQARRHIALDPDTGRVWVRSNGASGATGFLFVLQPGGTPFWTVVAQIAAGRDSGNDDLVIDAVANRAISGSGADLQVRFYDTTTNLLEGVAQMAQPPGDLELFALGATRRVYVDGLDTVVPVSITPFVQEVGVFLGGETSNVVALPGMNAAFVPVTDINSRIWHLSGVGFGGEVSGLPHSSGRYIFAGAHRATNQVFVLNDLANTFGNGVTPSFLAQINAVGVMTATYPVGNGAFGMAVNQANGRVHVPAAGVAGAPGGLSIVDPAAGTVTAVDVAGLFTTNISRNIAVVDGLGKAYVQAPVVDPGGSNLATYTETGLIATRLPASLGATNVNMIVANNATNRVYVGSQAPGQPNRILVIDAESDTLLTTLTLGSPSTTIGSQSYMAVDETRGRLYVADFENDLLHIVDASESGGHAVLATLHVGDGPTSVAINVTANRVYVGSTLTPHLTFVDGGTMTIRGGLDLPLAATFMDVDPASNRIYIAAGRSVLPGGSGVMVVADDSTFFTHPLTIVDIPDSVGGTVTVNADQTITFAPGVAQGIGQFSYRITDGESSSEAALVTIQVQAPVTILTAALPSSVANAAYFQQLEAVPDDDLVWSVVSGVLPAGTQLSDDGEIGGLTLTSGTFTFTVQARSFSNPSRSASRTFTISVGPPIVPNVGLPSALVGQAYSATLTAGGTTGALTWSLVSGTVPEGLTLFPSGVVEGAPTTAGTFVFTVRVDDAAGQFATGTTSIFVDGAPFIHNPPRQAVLHENYTIQPFTATRVPAFLALLEGTLPNGFSIATSGAISGTPQQTGQFPLTLRVTDARGRTDENAITLNLSALDQTIASGGVGATTQTFGPTRRLAQTFTAGTDGYLIGVRASQGVCTTGTMVVELRRAVGADVAVPDEDGPILATATHPFNTTPGTMMTFTSPVRFRPGERFALVFRTDRSCEFRNVSPATATGYPFGHALESVDGGPWQRIPGVGDLSVQTGVQPMSLSYLTTAITAQHLRAVLPGGNVLLAGTNRIAFVVNPGDASARRTTADMLQSRTDATATGLDDGTVLVVGGTTVAQTEVYSTATDGFALGPPLIQARSAHTATRLGDGRVMVAGGTAPGFTLSSVEFFNPGTNAFTAGGTLLGGRFSHTATPLVCPVLSPGCPWGGKVLIAGGSRIGAAPRSELFNPATGTSTATAGQMHVERNARPVATRLADGTVLVVGGSTSGIGAELYDPATDTWTPIEGTSAFALDRHTLTALPDGDAILAGGRLLAQFETDNRFGVYRYSAVTRTFTGVGSLQTYRLDASATPVGGDRIMYAGGTGPVGSAMPQRSFEFFSTDPATYFGITTAMLPPGSVGVPYPTTTIEAAGGTGPYTFEIVSGSMPPGLTFSNGTISGTPTGGSTHFFVVQVSDSSPVPRFATMPYRIGIDAIQVTSTILPVATTGVPYETQLTASGTGPWTWLFSSGSLPTGVTLSSSGVISGTPTATNATNTFRVRVEDANGQMAFASLSINTAQPFSITTSLLRDAVAGEGYGVGLAATGGSGVFTWNVESGTLPHGVTLTTSGTLAGSPWETGNFAFTARATDNFGRTDTQALTLHVGAVGYQRFRNNPNLLEHFANGPMAQVITAGVAGVLYGVRLDASCGTSEQLEISLQSVDETTGLPTGTVLMSDGPGAVPLTTTIAPAGSNVVVPLPGRRHFAIGSRFAVVLSAATGTNCSMQLSGEFGGPEALQLQSGAWVPFAIGQRSLVVGTVVDPDSTFAFASWLSGDHRATHLTCPVTGCGYSEQILLTGNTTALQLYDPATHRTTVVPNAFDRSFSNHTATRLQDGRVLIAGGWQRVPPDTMSAVSAAAFIFNPEDRTITPTGSMTHPRTDHRAVLLRDGRVLVVGGLGQPAQTGGAMPGVQEAEIFDPVAGSWSSAGAMLDTRWGHSATLLECPASQPACVWGGKVLVFGGWTDTWPMVVGELFNPAAVANRFIAVPGPSDGTRSYHAAVLLADGRVFLSGGWAVGAAGMLATTHFYDPATNTIAPGPDLAGPRVVHAAVRLNDDTVILAGGEIRDDDFPTASIERFNPATNTISGAGSMGTLRRQPEAVVLQNGRVVVSGGYSGWSRTQAQSLEVWDPGNLFFIQTTALPDGHVAVGYSQVIGVSGGDGAPSLQVIAGALPTGLVLFNDGGTWRIDGVPTAPGVFAFTLEATDGTGRRTTQALTIDVRNTLVVPVSTPPTAVVGAAYDVQLFAVGGAGTASTWALEPGFGRMPDGVALASNGRLTGTPTDAGSFSFLVRIIDNGTPQQTILQRIRMNVATADQRQETVNAEFQLPVPASGGNTYAQVMISGRSGRLTGVRLFTTCTAPLAVFIRPTTTTAPYVPTAAVLGVGVLSDASPPLQWRDVAFSSPPFLRAGDPFAISVQSGGDCTFCAAPNVYSAGSLYRAQVTNLHSWTVEGRDLAFVSQVEPLEPRAFGTATIDGRHLADEWNGAARMNVTLSTPNLQFAPATLFLQNDADNLYLSLVYERPQEFEQSNQVTAYFDADGDRDTFEAGEDLMTFTTSPTGNEWFDDNHQSHEACAPNTCWKRDEAVDPALEHGMARDSYIGRTVTVEASKPINSGDALDLAAELGQTLGLRVHAVIDDGDDEAFTEIPASPPLPWMLAAQPGACVLAPHGLVSWWTGEFEVPITDVHGSNNGATQGSGLTGDPGRFGEAYNFHGTSRIFIADTASLSPQVTHGQLTVEAWVNVATLPAGASTIIGKGNTASDREYMLVLQGSTVRFEVWRGVSGSAHVVVSAPAAISTGSWYHIVGTYQRDRSARLYVNGVLVAESTALSGTLIETASGLYIGGSPLDAAQFFNGLVDEPAIFNRELSPEEVRSLFLHGKCRTASRRYTLRVVTQGHGTVRSGDLRINCGGDCLQTYAELVTPQAVTLDAIPHSFGGVTFVGYTGDCTGLTCTVTMDADRTVFAQFTTNYQPWANFQSVATVEDTPLAITLTGGDPEGQPITFAVAMPPAHGTLTGTGASRTYTPDPGFVGSDSFAFTTHDGFFASGPAIVSIEVTPGLSGMFVRSYNTGAGNFESGVAVAPTAEGGYLVGRNVAFISDFDIVIAKLSASGATIWERRLQATGGQSVEELIQTSDGGVALVGSTGSNPFRLFIAKLDGTGAIQWQKVMGAGTGDDFLSGSIAEDGEGNLYVTSTLEYGTDGTTDIWVAKLTAAGAITWQKWLGIAATSEGETGLAIVDGGLIIVGRTTQGLVNGLLFHLDADGEPIAARMLATTSSNILPSAVLPVPGGGYVVAALAGGRPWVARFSASHTVVWSRDLAAGVPTRIDGATMRADGRIVVSGAIEAFAPQPPRWMAAFDIDGNPLFQQRYDPAQSFRNVVAVAADGGFALVGTRAGAFGDETVLIKADESGQAGCDYGSPTTYVPGTPGLNFSAPTGATTDGSASVLSTTLATAATVASNVVQLCPLP
jgi:hypothetical protein